MFLSSIRNSRSALKLPLLHKGSPIWQPYYTAAHEMDLALGTLRRNYEHMEEGSGINRLMAAVTRAGIFDLIEDLHELREFCEWRLQRYHKYHTQAKAQLDKRVREFEGSVRALDEQYGVKFDAYDDFPPSFNQQNYVYSLTVAKDDYLCIKLVCGGRLSDGICQDQCLVRHVVVTHKGHVTEADRKLAENCQRWLGGMEFQLSRDSFVSIGDYYEGVSFDQLIDPALEALKESCGSEYHEFNKARRELWRGTFEQYYGDFNTAQQVIGVEPTSSTAKIACVKAILNLFVLFEDYHDLLGKAKDIARYCFPMDEEPAFFDFSETYHEQMLAGDFGAERRDVAVISQRRRSGEPAYTIRVRFAEDGVEVRCFLDRYLQPCVVKVAGQEGSSVERIIGSELADFAASEDYYGSSMIRKQSPLRLELSQLERIGLGVKCPFHPLTDVYHDNVGKYSYL